MAGTSGSSGPGSEWQWNGKQWLWWNGREWLEAGVGPSPAVADPTAPDVTASFSEPVLSVIPNVALQEGFMGMDSTTFSLVFTNQRIVFARHDDALIAQLSQQEQQRAAAQGLAGWASSRRASMRGTNSRSGFDSVDQMRSLPIVLETLRWIGTA